MRPADIVPALRQYPDLEAQMRHAIRLRGKKSCGDCGLADLAADFRKKVEKRLERDKWLKKH